VQFQKPEQYSPLPLVAAIVQAEQFQSSHFSVVLPSSPRVIGHSSKSFASNIWFPTMCEADIKNGRFSLGEPVAVAKANEKRRRQIKTAVINGTYANFICISFFIWKTFVLAIMNTELR
jgi:hypothetical protein